MTINQFLNQNTKLLRNEIISEFESDFTTLDFIKKFARRFEEEYIDYLNRHKGNGAFKTIHGQIARFLAENEPLLDIRRVRKVKSEDVFGNNDETYVWEKKKIFFNEYYY